MTTTSPGMALRWQRLQDWASAHAPKLLRDLNGPVSEADLAALMALGWPLPEALVELLRLHDGERDSHAGSSLLPGRWLPVREMLAQRLEWLDSLGEQDEPWDAENEYARPVAIGPMQPTNVHPDRLPFLSAGPLATWFLDFAPAPGGNIGQVIRVAVESGEYVVCAVSLDAFLESYIQSVEAGAIQVRAGRLKLDEAWPPLAQVPWLRPELLDEQRIAVVGEACGWSEAYRLAQPVLRGPALLRVKAQRQRSNGKPRLALATLDEIRAAGAESEGDFDLRLEVLEQAGRLAERGQELDAALARQPRAQWFVLRARQHLELVQVPVRRMRPAEQVRWAATPLGQQQLAIARERAIADLEAALALDPRQTWWLELAELLLEGERWDDAEAACQQVIAAVDAQTEPTPRARERRETALERIEKARNQGSDDGDHSLLDALNELSASLRALGGGAMPQETLGDLDAMREAMTDVEAQIRTQQEEFTDDMLAADAERIAASLFQRMHMPPTRLERWAEPELDPKSAEGKYYARCERLLLSLRYQSLGDWEMVSHTALIGQRVRLRILVADDRRTFVMVWRLQSPMAVVEAAEFESMLGDGRLLLTTNSQHNPFEPPAKVETAIHPSSTALQLLHQWHQDRLDAAGATAIRFDNLADVVNALDHLRLLGNAHARSVRGASDRDLRAVLGGGWSLLGGPVRRALDRMIDASASGLLAD